MKTFTTKEKRSAPAVRKARSYVHHPMGPVQQAQQAAMRKILQPNEVQAKPDIGENDDKYEQDTSHVADRVTADLPVPAISGIPTDGPGGAPPLQRSENEEPEEELQRQPEEEEEESIQAKLIQRQPDNEEEEEPVQARLIQRKMADMRGIRPSRFGYVGPEAKAQQAEIHRILHSTGAQAKLTIGQPNDKYEQEADRVADQVMRMPDPKLQRQPENKEEEETLQTKPLADQITPLVQRQEEPPDEEEEEPVQAKFKDGEMLQRMCPECEEETAQRQPMKEEEEELQAKSKAGEAPEVTPAISSGIQSLQRGGRPLSGSERSFFEPRFGHDFSHVRVHADTTAAETAKAINARAFTLGNHVVMGSGEYQPTSQFGQRILGHELTHVIQQGEGRTSSKAQYRISIESGLDDGTGDGAKSNVISRTPTNNATTGKKGDEIQERTQDVLNYIKNEAKKRASAPPLINPNSKFYKVLKEKYLKDYLAKPSESEGKKAISKIGRTMEVRKRKGRIEVRPEGGEWRPATGGKEGWEASALKFWNTVNLPKLPKEVSWLPLFNNLNALPAEYHGATDILIKENTDILPYLDVPFLLGEPKDASKDIEADFKEGGKNLSQLMHWATGVKQAGISPEALRELFLLYEVVYMEAWDVFGQDPINDLIAEEQGRLLGDELLKGSEGAIKSEADLVPFLNKSFLQARAWVGSLLKLRVSELDAHILSKKPKGTLKYRQRGAKRKRIWKTTIHQLLSKGLSIESVKKHSLVNSQIEIYTLIYEADQWAKKYGEIKLSPLEKRLAEGSLSKTMDLFAKQIRNEKITKKDRKDARQELVGF